MAAFDATSKKAKGMKSQKILLLLLLFFCCQCYHY